MTTAELITDARALRGLETEWDDLAIFSRAPYCSPVWMLAWWRTLASHGCALRVIVVRDGGRVVGVAPFYAVRHGGGIHYRLLAASIASPVHHYSPGPSLCPFNRSVLQGTKRLSPDRFWTRFRRVTQSRTSARWTGRPRTPTGSGFCNRPGGTA